MLDRQPKDLLRVIYGHGALTLREGCARWTHCL